MAKTPICNSQIFLWKVMETGYTECFRVQGTTMYCKVQTNEVLLDRVMIMYASPLLILQL